eukprot:CAMPEP_0169401308 /NCGR_PEP_ID=MMETSP1017-20121227/54443_1 /TAXON_ID=342587 /ORGANISM="Karlodinium micrum, Strain CCMP2283" /LENGTH=143 /DNA_ID=CAMNT_0009507027 /DNA_START=37 /DNA_END=465 /DNA_ORIENTATION=-
MQPKTQMVVDANGLGVDADGLTSLFEGSAYGGKDIDSESDEIIKAEHKSERGCTSTWGACSMTKCCQLWSDKCYKVGGWSQCRPGCQPGVHGVPWSASCEIDRDRCEVLLADELYLLMGQSNALGAAAEDHCSSAGGSRSVCV